MRLTLLVLASAFVSLLLASPTWAISKCGSGARVTCIVDGDTFWLNGEKIVEYELWSDDWKARVAASKFAAWPIYGLAKTGYIGLQEHGSAVAYRNIRIRPIPPGGS